jgi:hypothetical protein
LLEFTMSRVSLFICGAVLLSITIIPVSGIFDERSDIDMTEVTDRIAMIMDSFWNSDSDAMIIRGWDILPSTDCSLSLNEHDVTINKNGRTYHGLMVHRADNMCLSYDQTMTVERGDGRFIILING